MSTSGLPESWCGAGFELVSGLGCTDSTPAPEMDADQPQPIKTSGSSSVIKVALA